VAERLDKLQDDGLVGQEPERPAGLAGGWCTAPAGEQPCLPRAIQQGTPGGRGLLLPVESCLQPLLAHTLSDAKHGMDTDGAALCNPCLRPGRAIRVRLHKAMGMRYLGGCSVPLARKCCQWATFLFGKTHDVLLVHGILRLRTRYALRQNKNLSTSKNKADKALYNVPRKLDRSLR
jgi:hypothetical protein